MWKHFNKGISTLIAISIILILAFIVGGYTLWQYSEIQKEKTEPISEIELIKESHVVTNEQELTTAMIIDFMDSRIKLAYEGKGDLDKVKSYLTNNAKEDYSQIQFIDFALIGISNPHFSRYEILEIEKLDSFKFKFIVRIYEEFTGEGETGCFDEVLTAIPVGKEYLIDSVEKRDCTNFQDETAGWKTYRNEEYGFEIKYPEYLTAENEEIIRIESIYSKFLAQRIEPLIKFNFFSKEEPETNIKITIYNNAEKYSLEEWLEIYKEISPIEANLGWREEISLSGEKGFKGGFGCCMTFYQTAFLGKNDKIYEISGGIRDMESESYAYEELFGQMFSTFKFFEKEISIPTENCEYKKGEYELRVYDSEGNVIGIIGGEIKQEIQDSIYISNGVVIYSSQDYFEYELFCLNGGNYQFRHSSAQNGTNGYLYRSAEHQFTEPYSKAEGETIFEAINIPMYPGQTHRYKINWKSLVEKGEGVELFIDNDGDTIFEETIKIVGNEFTCEEFINK